MAGRNEDVRDVRSDAGDEGLILKDFTPRSSQGQSRRST